MTETGTNRTKRDGRVGAALVAAAALLVGVLTGCAPVRDLPEQPPLAELQSIDLCALAPDDEVAAEVSDVIGRGWMRRTLGECWFDSPAGSFWLTLARDQTELPGIVRDADSEAETTEVVGGTILHDDRYAACGERVLISETGYIIKAVGGMSSSDATCEILDALGELVLRNLAESVPLIEWPEGTAPLIDLCGALGEHDVAGALGISDEIDVVTANRFDCVLGSATEQVKAAFDTRVSFEEGDAAEDVEIGGRPALASPDGCELAIDLGENAALADMIDEGRDALDVSTSSPNVDCAQLPEALDGLVRALAH